MTAVAAAAAGGGCGVALALACAALADALQHAAARYRVTLGGISSSPGYKSELGAKHGMYSTQHPKGAPTWDAVRRRRRPLLCFSRLIMQLRRSASNAATGSRRPHCWQRRCGAPDSGTASSVPRLFRWSKGFNSSTG